MHHSSPHPLNQVPQVLLPYCTETLRCLGVPGVGTAKLNQFRELDNITEQYTIPHQLLPRLQ